MSEGIIGSYDDALYKSTYTITTTPARSDSASDLFMWLMAL